ncbi:MAG TPA: hypothetical protein PL188_02835 [Candidatus Cloacimonadota bacterium]|nr:hypothetical protein [Candidatus Cloacimonadota bacterium]
MRYGDLCYLQEIPDSPAGAAHRLTFWKDGKGINFQPLTAGLKPVATMSACPQIAKKTKRQNAKTSNRQNDKSPNRQNDIPSLFSLLSPLSLW